MAGLESYRGDLMFDSSSCRMCCSQNDNSRFCFLPYFFFFGGYAVVQLVEALRYKPYGRRFDFLWSL
jgi:hypothetical protein